MLASLERAVVLQSVSSGFFGVSVCNYCSNSESFSQSHHSSFTLVFQSASKAPQSFATGMGNVGGYGGGGSLPVNGLTVHQTQVGANSSAAEADAVMEDKAQCLFEDGGFFPSLVLHPR